MLELAKLLEPYKLSFQELYRSVCIALTLPVSSASCERSFSPVVESRPITHIEITWSKQILSDLAYDFSDVDGQNIYTLFTLIYTVK